jgi:hypothetical protein
MLERRGFEQVIEGISTAENFQFRERLFLICDRCYWCASALPTRKSHNLICPECKESLSSLPIATGERYAFSCDAKRGVEVSFSNQ